MSNTPVPVSIAGDVTWGPCVHVMSPQDGMEMDVPMDWSPGRETSLHVLATSRGGVFHKGQALVLAQHDVGPLIPHMPGFNPISIAKASRRLVFSASSVKASGKPVGAVDGLLTMMVCGFPMSIPAGRNTSNSSHSVFVGVDWLDIVRGVLEIRKQLVKDAISVVKMIAEPSSILVDLAKSNSPVAPVDDGVIIDAVLDLQNSIVLAVLTKGREPVVLKIGTSSPYAGGGVEVSYQWEGHNVAGKGEVRIGGDKAEVVYEQGTKRTTVERRGEVVHDDIDGVTQL